MGTWKISAEDLDRAAAAVRKHCRETRLIPANRIDAGTWLKLETEQITGSFKVRGAIARLAGGPDMPAPVVTASAGNHGQGVAFAAKTLGIEARVFVPSGTPRVKREGIARLGAEVVVTGAAGYDETERQARATAKESGAVFVSPFDEPLVAAGNGGTLAEEVFRALPNTELIVAPVGGGGLVSGIAAARERRAARARIVGVQSSACPSMIESLRLGRPLLTYEGEETRAEGLEGGVSASTYAYARDHLERVDAVTEEQIAEAMRFARDELGFAIEGSAAVVLAWALEHPPIPGEGPRVLVLTGGNVDPGSLDSLLCQ